MNAIAYVSGTGRTLALGKAFAAGCARHGVACDVLRKEQFTTPQACDAVWTNGIVAPIFQAYEGLAKRVIGDLGYWREDAYRLPMEQRHVRITVDTQQPDARQMKRGHTPERFLALGLSLRPTDARGDYILLAGGPARHGYGWEAQAVQRIRAVTDRMIIARSKPSNPLLNLDGILECRRRDLYAAIRGAWAVVCRSGNMGADALLHGVPVFAEAGPGTYYPRCLELMERCEPLNAASRLQALADLAYCQWTPVEFAAGDLWAYLRDDGLV